MVGKGTIISNVDCEHMQLQAMRALLPTIRNYPFFLFFSKTLHPKSADRPISLALPPSLSLSLILMHTMQCISIALCHEYPFCYMGTCYRTLKVE